MAILMYDPPSSALLFFLAATPLLAQVSLGLPSHSGSVTSVEAKKQNESRKLH